MKNPQVIGSKKSKIYLWGEPDGSRFKVGVGRAVFSVDNMGYKMLTRLAVASPDWVNKFDLVPHSGDYDITAKYLYRLRKQCPIEIEGDHKGNYRLAGDIRINWENIQKHHDITVRELAMRGSGKLRRKECVCGAWFEYRSTKAMWCETCLIKRNRDRARDHARKKQGLNPRQVSQSHFLTEKNYKWKKRPCVKCEAIFQPTYAQQKYCGELCLYTVQVKELGEAEARKRQRYRLINHRSAEHYTRPQPKPEQTIHPQLLSQLPPEKAIREIDKILRSLA